MPSEVIKQVHRLAKAVEKYEGIVFTDMQGNIIEDQIHNNDANEAYRIHMSNANTGVINDPQYEVDHTNRGNHNQSHQQDEEYTMDVKTDTGEEEDRITIEDINIMTEMKSSQMAIEQQQEENTNTETPPENAHRFNLRKLPMKRTNSMSMTQTHHNTGVACCDIMTTHPKIHAQCK